MPENIIVFIIIITYVSSTSDLLYAVTSRLCFLEKKRAFKYPGQ